MSALGEQIRKLRLHHGWTQIEFANMLNISNTTLSQYETGARTPDDALKIKIADLFGVSMDCLMGRPEKEKKPTDIDALLKQAEQANANMTVIIGQGMERKIVHVPPEAEAIIKSAIDAFDKNNKNNQ